MLARINFMKAKLGFTLIEILIAIAILSMIGTAAIVMLSRGTSNVARGSFNTMAANQAALIAYYIRSDLSDNFKIELSDSVYTIGSSTYTLKTLPNSFGDTPRYSLTRKDMNNRTIKLGSDYITWFNFVKKTDYYEFAVWMKERDDSTHIASWSAVFYPKKASQESDFDNVWNQVTSD